MGRLGLIILALLHVSYAFEIRLISDSSGEKKEKSSADSQLVQIGEPKVNFIGLDSRKLQDSALAQLILAPAASSLSGLPLVLQQNENGVLQVVPSDGKTTKGGSSGSLLVLHPSFFKGDVEALKKMLKKDDDDASSSKEKTANEESTSSTTEHSSSTTAVSDKPETTAESSSASTASGVPSTTTSKPSGSESGSGEEVTEATTTTRPPKRKPHRRDHKKRNGRGTCGKNCA
jgi:hypothetical protein